ncbi:TIGR03790 family protein [Rhodoferax sp. AJA081-3]|uniref:TIGR03790 family protein n=1 Tax=Rhodoferax sp. AJA081-3 TaxID=2752316 RepID=UPI001FD75F0A|nr:TIGR03790 family protein [Rhodoferax sp. AJA081-3]
MALLLAGAMGSGHAQTAPARITAKSLGLVINTADPYSVAVGDYYAQRRGIPAEQVLRLALPNKASLNVAEFEVLAQQVREHMGPQVQALALAWVEPYAVECNAITSALTLGFQAGVCGNTCAPSAPSPLFNNKSPRPWSELGVRPSMLLASGSVQQAKALIDRGIASDQQLGKHGVPIADAVFVQTNDAARNVRTRLYPPARAVPSLGFQTVRRDMADSAPLRRVFLYQIGTLRVEAPDTIPWLPGALADHLTSFGGVLRGSGEQMSAMDWLDAGATASYGTVSEPCNHVQKFPHPQVLLARYLQGGTALEAYWGSVAWPAQGVLIGEPLAAPFAR